MLIPSNILAQKNNKSGKIPLYKTIPSSSFLTINAEYLGGYRPDQFFSAQVPAFGFKAGTMRNVGWFVSGMTNFNFKGAFVTCAEDDINPIVTSSSYFEALAGITLRYWKPFSFHLGLGYCYRSFNNETIYGQWAHTPNHTAQGPAVTAGLMLHLGGFVVSAEFLTSYNMQGINNFDYHVDKTRLTFGAKAGIGVCIPYNYRVLPQNQNPYPTTQAPQYYPVPEPTKQNTPAPEIVKVDAPVQKAEPVKVIEKPIQPEIITLPVSQLNPGWITISGEVAIEGDEPVLERGICWGTTYYPSVTGRHTSDGSGKGYFTTVISDLEPGTLYYFRAYAGTQSGIRYGNTVSVSIPNAPKAPVAPIQPLQGTQNPPTPQPPVMPTPPAAPQTPMVPQQQAAPQQPAAPQQQAAPQQPAAPQQQAAPQQPVAPQQQTAPQQPVAPQQQAAPQQPEVPQQQVLPQDSTATQQPTAPQETTPQQPANNEENPDSTNN